jgi:hypothetical protein
MAQKHPPVGREAFLRSFGNLTFERLDDEGRLTGYGLVGILARAGALLLGTAIIGGIVLSAANSFVAGLFGVPEFGELREMGFEMAAVLGVCLAIWFLIHSLRNPINLD